MTLSMFTGRGKVGAGVKSNSTTFVCRVSVVLRLQSSRSGGRFTTPGCPLTAAHESGV